MKGFKDIRWINFNHDQSLISLGTKYGCRLFSIKDVVKCLFARESKDLGIVQLQNSNLLLLTGASFRFPPNKLSIYDIKKSLNLLQIEFKSKILNVHWMKEWLVVVLQDFVHVYIINDNPRKLFTFETAINPDGVADLSCNESSLLAIPGQRNLGQVQIVRLSEGVSVPNFLLIVAHSSSIICLKLSKSGKLLATASEKGTLIRVWDVASCMLLNELRRGTDQATIYSLAFSNDESRMAVSSDKGTIHVFNLIPTETDTSSSVVSGNRVSVFSSFSSYLPKYFSSEWSWASFSLPVGTLHFLKKSPCIISFSGLESSCRNEDYILVLCADGSFYKYRIVEVSKTFSLEIFQVLWRGYNPSILKNATDFWDDWFEEGLV